MELQFLCPPFIIVCVPAIISLYTEDIIVVPVSAADGWNILHRSAVGCGTQHDLPSIASPMHLCISAPGSLVTVGDGVCGGADQEMPDDIRVTYQGPTLWEAILQLAPKTPTRPPNQPFRMSVIKMWNTALAPGVHLPSATLCSLCSLLWPLLHRKSGVEWSWGQ
jgi:translation elongation factor EF-1alpha